MNMSETARLILGLRAKGMSDTEITNLILFVETGEEQYKPKKEKKTEQKSIGQGFSKGAELATALTRKIITEHQKEINRKVADEEIKYNR